MEVLKGENFHHAPGLHLYPPAPVVDAPPSILSKLGFSVWAAGSNGDAGDYYCEHVFFVSEQFAREPNSSVLTDGAGHPMVGFIHVPTKGNVVGTQRVVAAALRGYSEVLFKKVPTSEPVRVAVTGFGVWGEGPNASGLISNEANLAGAVSLAFGDLVGKPKPVEANGVRGWAFSVSTPGEGERELQVFARELPVGDGALAGDKSVVDLLGRVRPHATVSLGMLPSGEHYKVETRADDGGLRHDNKVRHDGWLDPRVSYPRNEALWQAIVRGWRADW